MNWGKNQVWRAAHELVEMLDGLVLFAPEHIECLLGALPIIAARQCLEQRALNVLNEAHGRVLPQA